MGFEFYRCKNSRIINYSNRKDQPMSRKLSKLICFHNSEWGADYSTLEGEVEAFFDQHIEEADKKVKKDLEDKKTASLEALKPKVKSLDFWSKVKVVLKEKEVAATATTPSATKTKEDKQVLVPFPISPKVYHFHPIAFVEQMKRINGNGIGYVDWSFIKAREGKEVLVGYVPTKTITKNVLKTNDKGEAILKDDKKQFKIIKEVVARGKSGVTIASGFDIGQYSLNQIKSIFSSDKFLLNLYSPYSNKRKQDANNYLSKNPLEIDSVQVKKTDKLIKEYQLNFVIKKYNTYKIEKEFKEQSVGIQTVVTSICFQYGAASGTLSNMWKALEEDNSQLMYEFWKERALNTEYSTRRELELNYLKTNINTYK